ncbi:TOMM precursor leader peptide-binding protein [Bradyrhizobium sp. ARR65]|uniref:TOMM precursor leader peptide-binding protein n=1 Tax=Bradyrhizobium sp. ARR65 TaxID=1040989 RepID=UPI0004677ED4|nr:TOMM precursor leader peptide-binding protein [Bradyrhizobium sp. ARR65]
MTAKRNTKKADAVLQFAPNFTAYVLPGDVVCLYSEDRKFFLHGALYCALAEAIGDRGKSQQQLLARLKPKFPDSQIEEALKRLIERGYVVPVSNSFTAPVAGYWASLGLPPATAAEALKTCRVRIEAIDVDGAKELTTALRDLGVNIVNRSPDLTVTLVNDYLERRLAELNKQRVTDGTPWLLAQPSGVFPLVGPVFNPPENACWTCMFDRMIRNREIKGFLERGPARPVAVSPLVRKPFGQNAVHFAAVEIAKAIASGFRTDLNDHIASFDLLGATVARHYVAKRPQCPDCGERKLQNPRRAPKPIELGPGAKLVMTSGGYRTVTSQATVARFRRHVSPLTGVVKKLERIQADLPLNTNFFAQHNFSAPAQSLDQLRSGLQGGSFGKGSTAEQAEASALMEAIERYSGIFQGDEIRIKRRFTDFAPGEAILPNDVQLFSQRQFETRLDPQADDQHPVPPPLDPSEKIEWTPVWSLRDHRFRYVPTGLAYFFYHDAHTDSNGCAAGNTLEEAIVQGFLELVERDAYAIWWYNQVRRAELDLDQFDDSYVRDLRSQFAAAGRKVWVLDVTSDLGVPTYVAIMHWIQDGHENIEFGSGAHFDRRIALLRALTELNQFLAIGMMGGASGEKPSLDGVTPLRLENYPFLLPAENPVVPPAPGLKLADNSRGQVEACVDVAREAGYDFLVLDQTRPDVGVPVARVIVPGLRHFYRRFGPGRLYDIPVKLGLLDRPRLESELTPFLPHT